jgi:hypothetical protein
MVMSDHILAVKTKGNNFFVIAFNKVFAIFGLPE